MVARANQVHEARMKFRPWARMKFRPWATLIGVAAILATAAVLFLFWRPWG